MSFRVTGLDPGLFVDLHHLSDGELAARGARRVGVEQKPNAPCRISLDDVMLSPQLAKTMIGERMALKSSVRPGSNCAAPRDNLLPTKICSTIQRISASFI